MSTTNNINFFTRFSLKNKILIPTIVVTTIIFIGFTQYLIASQRTQNRKELENKAHNTVSLLVNTLRESLWTIDRNLIQEASKGFLKDQDIIKITIKMSHDTLVYTTDQTHISQYIEKEQEVSRNGEYLGTVAVLFTDYFIEERLIAIRYEIIMFSLILFILLIIVISIVSNLALTPLSSLLVGIQHVSLGNYDHRVTAVYKDELGEVASKFNEMALKIEELQDKAVTSAKVDKEMEIAKNIQLALLPNINNLPIVPYDVSAHMAPADEVGGDYYEAIVDVKGRLWFGIGDVTGHGLMPGLVMMMTQVAINTILQNIPDISPTTLLTHVNKIIHQNIRTKLNLNHHMTINFLLEEEPGRFIYAGAHEDILIYRAKSNAVELITTKGMWLGIIPDIEKQLTRGTGSFTLEHDDICLLYTDGVTEIMNAHREQYDLERLKQFLLKYGDSHTVEELNKILIDELNDFKYNQLDDITYLFFKRI